MKKIAFKLNSLGKDIYIDLKEANEIGRKFVRINESYQENGINRKSSVFIDTDILPRLIDILIAIDNDDYPEYQNSLRYMTRKDKMIMEQKELYENAFEPWTPELDEELSRLHSEGLNKKNLSTIFKRSTGAIESRLKRLGLL